MKFFENFTDHILRAIKLWTNVKIQLHGEKYGSKSRRELEDWKLYYFI